MPLTILLGIEVLLRFYGAHINQDITRIDLFAEPELSGH